MGKFKNRGRERWGRGEVTLRVEGSNFKGEKKKNILNQDWGGPSAFFSYRRQKWALVLGVSEAPGPATEASHVQAAVTA